jgi:hypothetical protein
MRSDLTLHERTMVPLCEQAIAEGSVLVKACSNSERYRGIALHPGRRSSLPHSSEAFFGYIEIDGRTRSVMGCRQRILIDAAVDEKSVADAHEFVMRDFLARANWTYPSGQQGGFSISKSICALADGSIAVFAPEDSLGPVDWRELNSIYNWVMLTINLHDFVFELGSIRRQIRQAVCVVQHPAFCAANVKMGETTRYRTSVGYTFVPYAPLKNYFGFGPGKFGAAVKVYTFEVTADRQFSVEMLFVTAPRCEKVFDFGRGVPDPVYGGARLMEKLSFGTWSSRPFRDWLDSKMLAQHCRVHQALIEGTARNWSMARKKLRVEIVRPLE